MKISITLASLIMIASSVSVASEQAAMVGSDITIPRGSKVISGPVSTTIELPNGDILHLRNS